MTDLMKVTSVVLFVSALFVPSASLDQFACYQDICNRDPTNPQYCNTKEGQKRCQHCDDVASSCGGPKMPYNCSNFCINREVEKQMQAEKVKACNGDSIPQTKNGALNGDHSILDTYPQGSVINYTCHDGYSPIGPAATCGPYGQWSSPPICQAKFCTLPRLNGLRIEPLEDRYPVLMRVRVTCTSDDTITVELKCTSNGTWDQPVPNCHIGDTNGDFSWIILGVVIFIGILVSSVSVFRLYKIKQRRDRKKHNSSHQDIEKGKSSEEQELLKTKKNYEKGNGNHKYAKLTHQNEDIRELHSPDTRDQIQKEEKQKFSAVPPRDSDTAGDTDTMIVVNGDSRTSRNKEQDVTKVYYPHSATLKQEPNTETTSASSIDHQTRSVPRNLSNDREDQKKTPDICFSSDHNASGDDGHSSNGNIIKQSVTNKSGNNEATVNLNLHIHNSNSYHHTINLTQARCKTSDTHNTTGASHHAGDETSDTHNTTGVPHHAGDDTSDTHNTTGAPHHAGDETSDTYNTTGAPHHVGDDTSDTHNTTGAPHHAGDDTSDTHNTTGAPHHAGDDTSHTKNRTGESHLPMEEGKHPVPETGNYPTEESEKVLSPRNKI